MNVCAAYERARSPHGKCETCRGGARTWRCLWRLLQNLCLSGVESLPSECRALRVRTIIGSVRVSGTQTPSTDSEVRRPLGSQEERLFNKIQSIICTLVLNKIQDIQMTINAPSSTCVDIFYKERNMLATSLPSEFKSFIAEFMEREYCLGFLQYYSSLVVRWRTILNDFLIFDTNLFCFKIN